MTRPKLGELLAKKNVVREGDLAQALAVQKGATPRRRLGQILVSLGLAGEDAISRTLAAQLELPWIDVLTQPIEPSLLWKVPRRVAEMHDLFAFGREPDGTVRVALADPLSDDALRDVEALVGKKYRTFVASASTIQKAIARHYDLEPLARRMLQGVEPSMRALTTSPTALELDATAIKAELQKSGPQAYVALLNFLFVNAIERLASDIHMEPGPDGMRVRFRIDGLLREVLHLPPWAIAPLVGRVKVVARMDVAMHRRPQDGKTSAHLGGRNVDLRVSTLPSQFGEAVVVRILDDRASRVDLGELGMSTRALSDYFSVISQPQGLLLVVGPTGSGKTTTLYASINRLKGETISICTLEDPIEQTIPGVKQVQIDEKSSLSFADAIRSLLRQDPNVLVIGEVRDTESATAAVDAATTGHLVITTLHTRQTIDSILRLLDLGMPSYLVGHALVGVVAQRLVRKVCAVCAAARPAGAAEWMKLGLEPFDLGPLERSAGPGCPTCQYTGYVGRVAVYEVLRMEDGLRALVLAGASEQALFQHAVSNGLVTLLDDALEKVRQGVTTLEEVARVVPIERWRSRAPSQGVSAPAPAQAPETPTPPPRAPLPVREFDFDPPPSASAGRPVALVVDDSDEILGLVRAALEDEYVVRVARDGVEALESIEIVMPDVAVLDVMMPRMSGYELCERLRSNPATEHLPVLMLSARGETPHVKEGLRAGADDYLPKPFDPEELVLRVRALLRRAGVLLRG